MAGTPGGSGARWYTRAKMLPFVDSLVRQITLTNLLDIAITALFIYGVFSLIRGTRAVTLVIGVTVLLAVYALAQWLGLRLFTQILQAGAVVGLFALVVVFQPELRRALERIGRLGTWGRILAPADQRQVEHVAAEVSRAAGRLARDGHGALIVIERETGLGEIAESGVMLHADLSHELLGTIFMPRTELHDGAVIIRGDAILAAAALLPLTEMMLSERFGTRHRAALGITEDTDAVAVVVSEESGQMSVVERARIVRVPNEAQLARALTALLEAPSVPGGLGRRGSGRRRGGRLQITHRSGATDGSSPLTSETSGRPDERSGGIDVQPAGEDRPSLAAAGPLSTASGRAADEDTAAATVAGP